MKSFSGYQSISAYLRVETIKIIASDGYVEASDTFEMKFNQIPFFYIF